MYDVEVVVVVSTLRLLTDAYRLPSIGPSECEISSTVVTFVVALSIPLALMSAVQGQQSNHIQDKQTNKHTKMGKKIQQQKPKE